MNQHRSDFGTSTPAAPVALQDPAELAAFIALLQARRVRSYLEIGARYGGTFELVMSMLPIGAVGVAIDFPGGDFGDARSAEDLVAAVRRLDARGYDARCIFGPSSALEVRKRFAQAAQPFDAVLIDGDHSYAGVLSDWQFYGRAARLVAFHDIAAPAGHANRHGHVVEVPRLWAELKSRRRHVEFVTPGSLMGIGVIFNEESIET